MTRESGKGPLKRRYATTKCSATICHTAMAAKALVTHSAKRCMRLPLPLQPNAVAKKKTTNKKQTKKRSSSGHAIAAVNNRLPLRCKILQHMCRYAGIQQRHRCLSAAFSVPAALCGTALLLHICFFFFIVFLLTEFLATQLTSASSRFKCACVCLYQCLSQHYAPLEVEQGLFSYKNTSKRVSATLLQASLKAFTPLLQTSWLPYWYSVILYLLLLFFYIPFCFTMYCLYFNIIASFAISLLQCSAIVCNKYKSKSCHLCSNILQCLL